MRLRGQRPQPPLAHALQPRGRAVAGPILRRQRIRRNQQLVHMPLVRLEGVAPRGRAGEQIIALADLGIAHRVDQGRGVGADRIGGALVHYPS